MDIKQLAASEIAEIMKDSLLFKATLSGLNSYLGNVHIVHGDETGNVYCFKDHGLYLFHSFYGIAPYEVYPELSSKIVYLQKIKKMKPQGFIKLSFDEIRERIEKLFSIGYFYNFENDYIEVRNDESFWSNLGCYASVLGEVSKVEEIGGNEGEGEHYHVIYEFIDHDVFIYKEGFYSSYTDMDFSSPITEVRPYRELVTKYK